MDEINCNLKTPPIWDLERKDSSFVHIRASQNESMNGDMS